MKLKSTLWALAFAVAAVSCSDDLEEGGLNNPQEGVDGPTAKINVAISTEAVTKAATKATPGEDGDGVDAAEVGDEDEYTVEDVAIILYSQAEGKSDWGIYSGCKLVAAGWTDQIGVMENSDATTGNKFPNGKMTTVEIAVKDGSPSLADENGKGYGVIAVTNLGKKDGEGLVAKIGAKDNGYSTVADLDKALYQNSTTYDDGLRHVMSTHAIDGSEGASTVTFKTSDTEIPSTSVYVERLSAKIRLSEYENNGFTYKINATMFEEDEAATQATAQDEIVLTDVAVFNRLKSGSFLLKRVSETVTGNADLGTDNAANDVIIGDETASLGVATNFVIDPWTRSKKLDENGNFPITLPTYATSKLEYTNQYTTSNYGQLWQTWSNANNTTSIKTADLDDQDDLFLCYTQENTLSIAGSVHGYTTGALFKATYYPAKWMALVTEDGATKGDVVAEEITYGTPKSIEKFYTYTSNGKEMIFEDYDAILGYIIAKAGQEGVSYYSFTNASDVNFGTNINKLRAYADEDPFGYIEKMVAEYDKTQSESPGTPSYQAIDTYLDSFTPGEGDAATAFNGRVKIYTGGVCYYPYLILHGGNGQRPTTPMEFGIVRNNIYDMTVKGISGLGYSEVDVTDPKEPDIDEKLKIQVNLYVKNWVVRSNSGIIL